MVEIDELEMRRGIGEILNRRPTVGLAVGVVRDGCLRFFHGHGVADLASGAPITRDTVFPIASITKTFTAIAVMQLWEQGLLALDAPANDYLRAYQLIPADTAWRPATVRHLLTHTAGIGEVVPAWGLLRPDFGESVRAGRPLPSLAEYYRGGLRLHAEPGTMFRYGNHGPATLGQIVEDVSGQTLDGYLREHVFEPLGMTDTGLGVNTATAANRATGYTIGAGGPRAVTERPMVTVGAASAWSTARDMARYVAALTAGGANEHGAVLKPGTVATMFEPHYQPDPRIPGIGLMFFRGECGSHRIVEHQGIAPGFDSQILVAPDDGLGIVAFTNGTRLGMMWMPNDIARLLEQLLGVSHASVRTDVPQRPEVWSEICGRYHLPGPLTDARVRAMIGAGVEVFVRHGQLVLRALTPVPALYRGFALHPDDDADPYAFRIDLAQFELDTFRVVFTRDPAGATTVHLDVQPLSARRQTAATNPTRWFAGAVAGAAIVSGIRRRRAAQGEGHTA